jgi:hypothetical protein
LGTTSEGNVCAHVEQELFGSETRSKSAFDPDKERSSIHEFEVKTAFSTKT